MNGVGVALSRRKRQATCAMEPNFFGILSKLHLPVNASAQNMFSRDVKRLSFMCQTLKFSRPIGSSLSSMGVLVVHSVLLTVHCQRGQEISKNLFTDMESRKSIEDFLRDVDEDLLIYAGELRSNGFTSTASAMSTPPPNHNTPQNPNLGLQTDFTRPGQWRQHGK